MNKIQKNKLEKNGFTIIEILSVIVILSIIVLIAYPFVFNIILESKQTTEKESVKQIAKAAELYYNEKMLTDGYSVQAESYSAIINGVKGKKPDEGQIYYNKKGDVALSVRYGSNCYTKAYDTEEIIVTTGEICELPFDYMVTSETNPSVNTNYLNGPIKRNKIETLVTLDYIDSTGSIGEWDVSEKQNGTIMAWYKDEDNDNLYEVYIGANDVVRTNPNSSNLFRELVNLTTLDISNLSTTITTNMELMFCGLTSLEVLDVSNLNTSNVTNMRLMFGYDPKMKMKLKEIIGLENFDTSKVTDMAAMFQACQNLEYLDLSNFNTSKVTNMANLFMNCQNLLSLKLSNWNTSQVTDMSVMFGNCINLKILDLSSFDTSKVTNMSWMFAYDGDAYTDYKLMALEEIIGIENFNTSKVTTMYRMFNNCGKIKSLNFEKWDTSNVTNMEKMFSECVSLMSLNLSNWNTSQVTNMSGMFRNCYNLTTLDLSSFDTSNVTSMGTYELKHDDGTEQVGGMFQSCSKLKNLDLSSFDTSKVTNISKMFYDCNNLETINLSDAIFTSVENYKETFKSSSKLKEIIVKDSSAQAFITKILTDDNIITDVKVTIKI